MRRRQIRHRVFELGERVLTDVCLDIIVVCEAEVNIVSSTVQQVIQIITTTTAQAISTTTTSGIIAHHLLPSKHIHVVDAPREHVAAEGECGGERQRAVVLVDGLVEPLGEVQREGEQGAAGAVCGAVGGAQAVEVDRAGQVAKAAQTRGEVAHDLTEHEHAISSTRALANVDDKTHAPHDRPNMTRLTNYE